MSKLKTGPVIGSQEEVEFARIVPTETTMTARKHDGTVQLTSDRGVILIPTPSKDPRDPLNIPVWHKLVILGMTSLCKSGLNFLLVVLS
jgi:hypothetical protein